MAKKQRRAKPPLIYVDSCIFLNVIKRECGLWPDSLKTLLAAERGDIQLIASTLVLVEVASHKGDVDPTTQDAVIERYLVHAPVTWYELDWFVAEEARLLCAQLKLRGADAAHLATAIRAKCVYFVSRDQGFPYGQQVNGVAVTEPTLLWDPTTDDAEVDRQAEVENRAAARAETAKLERRRR